MIAPDLEITLRKLSALAYAWRCMPNARHTAAGHAIVQQYHAVMTQLWAQGWRGYGLQFDAELPDDLLPEFFRAHWHITDE